MAAIIKAAIKRTLVLGIMLIGVFQYRITMKMTMGAVIKVTNHKSIDRMDRDSAMLS